MRSGSSFRRVCMGAALIAALAAPAIGPTTIAADENPAEASPAAAESAATESAVAFERAYLATIQPLFKQFCFECHAGDLTEAEIDLDAFKTVADARKQVKTWLKVREMLDSGQMPPKDSPQPTDTERGRLQAWVRDFLAAEAVARAGDPGPVVLRRLINAEYNYTVRDLTGVSYLDPTREFPVDGAAGEGFTNTGSAQAMSPSLVTKYLDAAKEVAAHAVLLPDGMRFSPHTTRRDHTDEWLARIQEFYREFTEDGGGSSVNLQGIQFNTNQGGLLPLEKYLAATLDERDALAGGRKTIEDVARQRSLNARYLATLWRVLAEGDGAAVGRAEEAEGTPSSAQADSTAANASLLIDAVRAHWRQAKPGDASRLAAEVAVAQQAL